MTTDSAATAASGSSSSNGSPVLMTGDEYRASLRDGRVVYYRNERVNDVTTHPVTRGAVDQVAEVYDSQHATETRDLLTYVREDGERVSRAWMLPRTIDDLVARREMVEHLARQTFGTFGRHMDMGATTQLGALAQLSIFRRECPEHADNIPAFIRSAQDRNAMIAGCLVDPQGKRSKRREGDAEAGAEETPSGFPAHLHVVREDSSGFWVRGPKAVGTALPYSHECFVTSVPGKAPDESFWFNIPVNSPGLSLIIRESLAHGSRWEHPLAGRGDEVDAMVLFDDVFVPWDRVFMLRKPAFMFGYAPIGALEYWYTLTRVCVKAELIAAVIQMVVETLNTGGSQIVRQQVAEVNQYAITLRSFVTAAEALAQETPDGAMWPDGTTITAGRAFGIEQYPRILHILQELCGQGSMMSFAEEDYDSATYGERLHFFLEGHELGAKEKATLLNLAWDLSSDGYGGRVELFEKLNGFPLFLLKEWIYRGYDRSASVGAVKRFLDIA